MYHVYMNTKIQNQSTKNDPVLVDVPKACSDELAAVEFLEKQRWGNSPACPVCGVFNVYKMMNSKTGERQANYRWRCNDCKSQFTVRIGTVLEESRIPFRHWCYAFWRASTSKEGVSALEIKRQTGLSYKSALFLLNRIRFAMDEPVTPPLDGKVEIDETYVGGKVRYHGTKHHHASNDKARLGVGGTWRTCSRQTNCERSRQHLEGCHSGKRSAERISVPLQSSRIDGWTTHKSRYPFCRWQALNL